jgi:glutamate/tyrosine decarboxylase-like PLP-dependent enzyme
MREAISDRTVMLIGSAPCYPYGLIDPIPALSDLALEHDLWLHVDACIGGYFAPFARMNGIDLTPFDFSVPGVRTMSADLHKYGYAAKGASTIFHRSEAQRELQMFSCDQWACGEMKTPSVAGTRPGGAIASAWAVMNYLGVKGYCDKVQIVTDTRKKLAAGISSIDGMGVFGDPKLGMMIYGSKNGDTYAIWQEMYSRGWFSPPLNEPDSIHLMISPGHARIIDEYVTDLRDVVAKVRAVGESSEMQAQYN